MSYKDFAKTRKGRSAVSEMTERVINKMSYLGHDIINADGFMVRYHGNSQEPYKAKGSSMIEIDLLGLYC